ncbi:galactose-specific lectin nattectin-like isoform X2 [Syngnathoides biaculeatus]|uniref:galactose-specific lectin nattectin-like isoform X2 n=1 Tax=Syngnathoides biaculeatus TaxID=300417 RepID=UPI002ADE6C06|nr:galactose-specific lectin nattectin-like isoform X2 [Syngnathoides biaculeatus]
MSCPRCCSLAEPWSWFPSTIYWVTSFVSRHGQQLLDISLIPLPSGITTAKLIPITSGITIAKMDFCLHLLLLLCCISGLFTGAWAFAINRDRYCPPEWTRLDNRCLIFQNEELNFALAETVCNILGGNLVSIHNSLENEVVRHLILAGAGSFQRSWIGLYDRIVDGEFLFTDGSPFDFDDWANGRPRVDTNQDCVEINFQGETWNDIRCAVRRSFVCAKDLKH